MKKLSKRNIKLTGLIALFALVFALGLNASTVKVNAEGEAATCQHKNKVHYSAKDAGVNEDEAYNGNIEYNYCPDCGKYAEDSSFINLLSADEIIDYWVADEVVVELGGDTLKAKHMLLEDTPSGIESVSFEGVDFSKYKYIAKHSESGKTFLETTKDTKLYKNTLKPITIKVVTKCADPDKKGKYVTVKFVLPEPKVKVKKKWNGNRCTYTFKYNIKGATKVKMRMVTGNKDKVINNSSANKVFDKYMIKAKSDKDSYISIPKSFLNKYNNNINFKLTAYYGKKKVSTTIMP